MTKIESNPVRTQDGCAGSANFADSGAAARKPYLKPVLDDYGDASEVTKNNHPGNLVPDITASYS